jgi:predicted kinase
MSDAGYGRLLLITGPSAAGKSTVGHEVAKLLPRAVHVDGDVIANFVVSGAVHMDLPPAAEAVEQLMLRYAAAMSVASLYRRAGFDAILTDNIFEAHLTGLLFMAFADAPAEPVHVVVLDPPLAAIRARYDARPGGGYTDTLTPEALKEAVARTPRVGLWIDNGNHQPADTAAEILDRLDEAGITQHVLLRRINEASTVMPS